MISPRPPIMLFDANETGRAAFERMFDVCVIGAGPAGITLARRLAAQGLDVALMEGGGFDFDPASQDCYAGDCSGQAYFPLDECRLRFFGGTSGHWDGKCRPLEAADFAPRSCNPRSGWPIDKTDLDTYAPETAQILDLDSPEPPPDLAFDQAEERFRRIQWRFSAPTRFGEKYRDELIASQRISLCLNANLVNLRLGTDLTSVEGAEFRSYQPGDPGFGVRARAYALCLGGLENARMLLNFRDQMPAGIGNGHDLVGRYFCEHPTVFVADMLLVDPLPIEQQVYVPTEAFLTARNVSNFAVLVEPQQPVAPKGIPLALRTTAECITPSVMELIERLRGYRPKCTWGGIEEYEMQRDPEAHPWAKVAVSVEQRLNPDSRLSLSDQKDDFGLRRICIDWQLTSGDYETFRAAILAYGAHVVEQDIGRLRVRDWLLEEHPVLPSPGGRFGQVAGRHHMGTTRMCSNPRTGVVDADCRVHGIGNLYVGGSSVFSNGGFTKPTFTIVQLALRLGDRIGATLAS